MAKFFATCSGIDNQGKFVRQSKDFSAKNTIEATMQAGPVAVDELIQEHNIVNGQFWIKERTGFLGRNEMTRASGSIGDTS